MPNPFTNTGKIEDRRYFFGRKEQLDEIFDRLNGVQPGSVNLVGERRIGRSSLLWHIQTIASERLPNRFRIAYLELQSDSIDSPDTFRACALRELGTTNVVKDGRLTPVPADMFENLLTEMHLQKLVPVLLLDEFESVVESSKAFKDTFFDGLRSLCSRNLLTCVYVTRKPLSHYKTTHPIVSTLHGLCIKVDLGDFGDADVRALLSQPTEFTLKTEQMNLARSWAGKHPLRLNLAGKHMYEQLERWHGAWSAEQTRAAEQKYRKDVAFILAEQSVADKAKQVGVGLVSALKNSPNWLEAHWKVAVLFALIVLVACLLLFGLISIPQLVGRVISDIIGTPTPVPTTTPLPTLTPTP